MSPDHGEYQGADQVSAGRALRVAIVEDEVLFRDLLGVALSHEPGIEVVGSFPEGTSAVDAAATLRPDVVLMDIELGGPPNGIEAAARMRAALPALGVVILSNHSAPEFVASLPLGPSGWSYLLKKSAGEVSALRRAIEGAAAGMITLDPQIVASLSLQDRALHKRLTARQLEILGLIAEGHSNTSIARRLVVTERTVENHISALYRDLGLNREADTHPRVRAVRLYLESMEVARR
jgi:DNA-binding NarL/FixJ family response regulator